MRLEREELPTHRCRVTDKLCRTSFKHHDDAGLIKFGDALVDKLDAKQSLAASDPTPRRGLHWFLEYHHATIHRHRRYRFAQAWFRPSLRFLPDYA
jgi:hypothetical protein